MGKNKVRKPKSKNNKNTLSPKITKADLKRGKTNLYILYAMIIAACGLLFYGLGF
ncbi:putative membrane protein [Halobacteriovorax marinus SJ]|uniref:Membrane protein n=1 Tax=Halobacteriovorax marinus (strain ATCC BAA-682 / DSM 15412 / SJ) TaxID=862908 RepID=E1X509_HALMS|nr:hypothetical protein [Halobacteriovorax marinus]CBW27235.1 putative membrane protein [Halobacteriovorax marinus SJ]